MDKYIDIAIAEGVEDTILISAPLNELQVGNLVEIDDNDSIFREQNHLSAIIMPRAPAGYCYMTKQLVLLDTNLTKFNRSMMLASCTKLRALVLRNTDAVAQLDPTYTKFTVTAIAAGNGYVYVPRALVEDYKVATNWSAYADQIRVIEDYTEDGTLDGPMDETKI